MTDELLELFLKKTCMFNGKPHLLRVQIINNARAILEVKTILLNTP